LRAIDPGRARLANPLTLAEQKPARYHQAIKKEHPVLQVACMTA
jgi:hypothetical protein